MLATLKKFDLHHWSITFLFFVGLAMAAVGLLQGLPAGITPMQAVLLLVPAFIASANTVSAFFKNPPQTPDQALAEGEHAAGGAGAKAGARGMVAMRAVIGLSVAGLALFLMFGATQGCSWWQKSQQPIVQDIDKDGQCVLGAILGGAQSPQAVVSQCVGLTESQVLAMAASLFNFYVLGQQDAGFAGAALPPYHGLPASLPPADVAKLRAFAGS